MRGLTAVVGLYLLGLAVYGVALGFATFRTRAVDNFMYLIVAMRGRGSMIISPKGQIMAQAKEPDGLAIADIAPFGRAP